MDEKKKKKTWQPLIAQTRRAMIKIILKCGEASIPHINSETNPPLPIINVVCKYLRQFLGTSFEVATLPIYHNIEYWGGT